MASIWNLFIIYRAANTCLETFVVEGTYVQRGNHLSQMNRQKLFGMLYVDFLSSKYSPSFM